MSSFASEARAPGICDRCGERWPLKQLKTEYVRGSRQGNRVCPICWDADHPQNWQGSVKVLTKSGLRDPRSDRDELKNVRSLPGWNPVGNPGLRLRFKIGNVTVTTT